jgi:hypothetical protein
MQSCAWCHGDKTGTRPDLKPVTDRARPKKEPSTGMGGSAGGGSGEGVTTPEP